MAVEQALPAPTLGAARPTLCPHPCPRVRASPAAEEAALPAPAGAVPVAPRPVAGGGGAARPNRAARGRRAVRAGQQVRACCGSSLCASGVYKMLLARGPRCTEQCVDGARAGVAQAGVAVRPRARMRWLQILWLASRAPSGHTTAALGRHLVAVTAQCTTGRQPGAAAHRSDKAWTLCPAQRCPLEHTARPASAPGSTCGTPWCPSAACPACRRCTWLASTRCVTGGATWPPTNRWLDLILHHAASVHSSVAVGSTLYRRARCRQCRRLRAPPPTRHYVRLLAAWLHFCTANRTP
jgi:hypothetical protein